MSTTLATGGTVKGTGLDIPGRSTLLPALASGNVSWKGEYSSKKSEMHSIALQSGSA